MTEILSQLRIAMKDVSNIHIYSRFFFCHFGYSPVYNHPKYREITLAKGRNCNVTAGTEDDRMTVCVN